MNRRRIYGAFTAGALAVAAGAVLQSAQRTEPPVPAVLQNYKPVTADRLKRPDDRDWLMIRRTYDGWGFSPLDQITPANVARLQPVWSFATGAVQRPRGDAAREQRRDVRLDAGQPGHRHRRADRRAAVALPRSGAARRDQPAPDQPRRGAVRRQGVFRASRGGARRARRQDRQGLWSATGRGQPQGLLHVARAARRRRQGDGRRVGRRARRARIRRRLRRRDRQAGVEDLHRAGARRAGQRDLAERRSVEDRRRLGLGHRQLRSRNQPGVLGHRQRRSVDGRPAARRQSLHRVDHRDRRRDRPDQGPSPVQPERVVGLGRGVAADSRRLPAQRPNHQGTDRRRAQRLPLVSRAQRRPIKFVDATPYVKQNVFRGLDPKTGRPDVDPARKPGTGKLAEFCPSHLGRQELAAGRVQPA